MCRFYLPLFLGSSNPKYICRFLLIHLDFSTPALLPSFQYNLELFTILSFAQFSFQVIIIIFLELFSVFFFRPTLQSQSQTHRLIRLCDEQSDTFVVNGVAPNLSQFNVKLLKQIYVNLMPLRNELNRKMSTLL